MVGQLQPHGKGAQTRQRNAEYFHRAKGMAVVVAMVVMMIMMIMMMIWVMIVMLVTMMVMAMIVPVWVLVGAHPILLWNRLTHGLASVGENELRIAHNPARSYQVLRRFRAQA
jgi:ABC-type multidrug transport system fused ATPase/permease subunit